MALNTHEIRQGAALEQVGAACLIGLELTVLFLISRKHSYPHFDMKTAERH